MSAEAPKEVVTPALSTPQKPEGVFRAYLRRLFTVPPELQQIEQLTQTIVPISQGLEKTTTDLSIEVAEVKDSLPESGKLDNVFDAELDKFIPDKISELEAEREKQRVAEKEAIDEYKRRQKERSDIIVAGNNRANEIIQESGLREILEQARVSVARYYPSATLAEKRCKFLHGEVKGLDDVTIYREYLQFRLGWKSISVGENDYSGFSGVNVWDPWSNGGSFPEFHFFEVICSGWKENITYVPVTSEYAKKNPLFVVDGKKKAYSYEREDSLAFNGGSPGIIKLLNNEYRNLEKIQKIILELIKKPSIEKMYAGGGSSRQPGDPRGY